MKLLIQDKLCSLKKNPWINDYNTKQRQNSYEVNKDKDHSLVQNCEKGEVNTSGKSPRNNRDFNIFSIKLLHNIITFIFFIKIKNKSPAFYDRIKFKTVATFSSAADKRSEF